MDGEEVDRKPLGKGQPKGNYLEASMSSAIEGSVSS